MTETLIEVQTIEQQQQAVIDELIQAGEITAKEAELLPTVAEVREAYRAAAAALRARIRADVPNDMLEPVERDYKAVRDAMLYRSCLLDGNDHLIALVQLQIEKEETLSQPLSGKEHMQASYESRARISEFFDKVPQSRKDAYTRALKDFVQFMRGDFAVFCKDQKSYGHTFSQDMGYGEHYAPHMPEKTRRLFARIAAAETAKAG